jgi:hypothetical protein
MARRQYKPVYQDFIISDARSTTVWDFIKHWLRLKTKRAARSTYGTQVRRVGKHKVELTFDLPPTIRQRMQRAVSSGKQIRLVVLR